MPEPTNSPAPVAAPAVDAGLDAPFAQLFGGGQPDVLPTTAPTPDAPIVPSTPDPVQLQTPDPATPANTSQQLSQAFELKTRTGTVYKSMEDAVNGIEVKDTLIGQLRQFAIERTGVDPITGQSIGQPRQQVQPQAKPEGYLNNSEQYFKDLYDAYSSNDPKKYFSTQQKLIEEKFQAEVAPFASMLLDQAKLGAVQRVSQDVPDFNKFHNSTSYKETLQKFPSLANAVAVSESNAQFAHQLPDLYKMVHQLHQAATLPDLIKQQQSAATPPLQPRPTLTSSQVTPPQMAQVPRNANLTDAQTRKAVIDAFEGSGKADQQWRR